MAIILRNISAVKIPVNTCKENTVSYCSFRRKYFKKPQKLMVSTFGKLYIQQAIHDKSEQLLYTLDFEIKFRFEAYICITMFGFQRKRGK